MTFFGITLFAEIDLPEFPFPDLGLLGQEDELHPGEGGPGRRPAAPDAGRPRAEGPAGRWYH